MQLVAIPAFADNYIWLIHDAHAALVVDPGDAQPVFEALKHRSLKLSGILVTHHHDDHIGGIQALNQATGAPVWGPSTEACGPGIQPVAEGSTVQVLGLAWRVIDVPGHTRGHVAYFCEQIPLSDFGPNPSPVLFCGDTLFSGGCGRIFEGTPQEMHDSLNRLSKLPGNTLVCCAHEYTCANLRFARKVDPGNLELAEHEQRCLQWRSQGRPTLPSTLARELSINPFLRCDAPEIQAGVQAQTGCSLGALPVFTALRQWKNIDR